MKYILEIPQNKAKFAKDFFKSISFVKSIKEVDAKEITNKRILKSINDYETKKKN
jgi:hypothetical protein